MQNKLLWKILGEIRFIVDGGIDLFYNFIKKKFTKKIPDKEPHKNEHNRLCKEKQIDFWRQSAQ